MLNNINKSNPKTSEKKEIVNAPRQGLVSRLIESFKNKFVPATNVPPPTLQGRIHESPSKQANKILDKFLKIAKKFEKHLDAELVGHVQAAMESIKRDYHRIQKKASQSPDEQVYDNWMKKAKGWIELDENLHDRAAIINAVIKQQFSTLDDLIDQDLQLIFDYETHILSDLPISSNEKSKIEEMILSQLTPHTQALIKLKTNPPKLELHKVAQWKENIDRTRGHHFEKALHAIDAIVNKMSTATTPVGEANATTEEINTLRQKTHALLQEASELSQSDEKTMKKIESLLLPLQNQVHHLSGDLNLTHDHFEQLKAIQLDLEQVGTKLCG